MSKRMTKERREAIMLHTFRLRRIFPKAQTDDLYARLHRIEAEAHSFAERCCNEPIEDRKVVALETELVVVDAAIERTENELGEIRGAIATLTSDDAFLAHEEALISRGHALVTALDAVPRGPVESGDVRLSEPETSEAELRGQLGAVIAVRVARAADVKIASASSFAHAGKPFSLSLALSDSFGRSESDDRSATLARLTRHVRAALLLPVAHTMMPDGVWSDPVRDCVFVRFLLPPDLPIGTDFTVAVAVAGERPVPCLEHRARVIRGVSPSLRMEGIVDQDYRVPVASASGLLYVPHSYNRRELGTDPGEMSLCDPLGQSVGPPIKLPTLSITHRLFAAVAELPPGDSGPLLILCGCAADPATSRPFDRLSLEAYRTETFPELTSSDSGALWTVSITSDAMEGLSELACKETRVDPPLFTSGFLPCLRQRGHSIASA